MRFTRTGALSIIFSLAFSAMAAHAAIITQTFSGTITDVDEASPFSIDVGDIFTIQVAFNTDLLTGTGLEELKPDTDPVLKLLVTIGEFAFTEQDDQDFPDFPEFRFEDGQLVSVDLQVNLADGGSFDLNDGFLFIKAPDFEILVTGEHSFTPVPEPMALALFGLGLAGIRLARRALTTGQGSIVSASCASHMPLAPRSQQPGRTSARLSGGLKAQRGTSVPVATSQMRTTSS